MSLRRKILLAFIAIVSVTFLVFAYWAKSEIRDVHAQVVEDLLVDISQLLATSIERDLSSGRSVSTLKEVFSAYRARKFHATILDRTKDDPTLDIYVTDAKGIVIFSSRDEREVGQDYSKWNDVYRTLQGSYGARSTRVIPDEDASSVYYIAAPIHVRGELAGVVSVIKPRLALKELLQRSSENLAIGALIAAVSICVFGAILVILITGPIDRLKAYALEISEGRSRVLPELPHQELKSLGDAFEKMRISLEGKKSIETFTQALTHELKSPLTVIRGGAELALEPMETAQRERFLRNIITESARAELILQTLLQISALETKTKLDDLATVPLKRIVESAKESLLALRESRHVRVELALDKSLSVTGDEFLLTQMVRNLLQNAIEFSNEGGAVKVTAASLANASVGWRGADSAGFHFESLPHERVVRLSIQDSGVGIPEYARTKVFDKFFSIERPATGRKGTGLGLSFAREVVKLHRGAISLESRAQGGVEVLVDLPILMA